MKSTTIKPVKDEALESICGGCAKSMEKARNGFAGNTEEHPGRGGENRNENAGKNWGMHCDHEGEGEV